MDVKKMNVIKYRVICSDKVIAKGTTKYYSDVIPDGYEYAWAFKTPDGIFLNVMPSKTIKTEGLET